MKMTTAQKLRHTPSSLNQVWASDFTELAEEPSFELADFRSPQQDKIYDRQN